MKRHIALLVILCMVASALMGCGESSINTGTSRVNQSSQAGTTTVKNFNATGYPIVNDKITLEMMGAKHTIQGPWDQLVLFTEMEKMTNIHFEFDTPTQGDAYNEKKGIVFASNDLPDVFNGAYLTPSEEVNYGSQGILIPLENLIDQYAPNLKKLLEDNPVIKRTITTLDGHIYALPYIVDTAGSFVYAKMWINEEWIKNLNMQMPETMDDLYVLLKAFKEKDPNQNGKNDEIPLSFTSDLLYHVREAFLSSYGLLTDTISKMDVKDDKVIYTPIEKGYKEYLKFMNQLFLEGLIDPESFTQTSQQMTAKGNAGLLGLFGHAGSYVIVKMEDYTKYPAMPVLTSSMNTTKMWPGTSAISRGTFAITNKNEHPESTIRWIDYFYSEEGGAFLSQGPEGLGWRWTDSSKTAWEKILPSDYKSTEEFRGGKITPNCGTLLGGKVSSKFINKINLPQVQNLEKELVEKYVPYLKYKFPNIYFKDDEQKRITALETDLNKYVDQMEARFITGDASLDTWDEYVNTIKKMGAEDLVDYYQTGYDRWKSVK